MASPRQSFVAQFQSDRWARIVEYAKQISTLNVDVCVFTARKAACLFDALRELGLAKAPGIVVSDRVLDMDHTWIRGKRVALIDDVLISGSTLYRTKEKLLAAGAASVDTIVLAIDEDYWVDDLVTPSHPAMRLEDRDAIALCAEIIEAMSVVPRPYNLDWPLVDGLSIAIEDSARLAELPDWQTIDLSSPSQEAAGVRVLTCEAGPDILRRLEASLGIKWADNGGLFKIRLYARPNARYMDRLTLRVLPIFAFGDLPIAVVDETFRRISRRLAFGPMATQFATASSRLRLIQYIASSRLAQLWLDDLRAATKVAGRGTLEENQLSFIFSPPTAALVRSAVASDVKLGMTGKPSSSRRRWGARSEDPVVDFARLQEALTDPFRDMYPGELRARKVLKKYGAAAFEIKEHARTLNRLDIGIGFHELESIVAHNTPPHIDPRVPLSVFLDLAVDAGIVVPIMHETGAMVRRAFRHGEDILYSDVDLRTWGIMLANFLEASRRTSVPKIMAEKLCVLMLKIGVREKKFNRWLGRLGAGREVLGVRWDLHGAVLRRDTGGSSFGREVDPNIGGVMALLTEADIVEYDAATQRYSLISDLDDVPTHDDLESLAAELGAQFGELLALPPGVDADAEGRDTNEDADDEGSSGGRISPKELTLLASCEGAHEVARALGAEVDIATGVWQRGNPSGPVSQTLRKAINNGLWKARSFESGVVRSVQDRIAAELPRVSSIRWKAYWAPTREEQVTDQSLTLTIKLTTWLRRMVALTELLSAIDLRAEGKENAKYRKHLSSFDELLAELGTSPYLAADELKALERLAAETPLASPAEIRVRVVQGIGALIPVGRGLVGETRAEVDSYGRARNYYTYPSALAIVVPDGAPDDVVRKVASASRRSQKHQMVALYKTPRFPGVQLIFVRGNDPETLAAEIAGQVAKDVAGIEGVRILAAPSLRGFQQVHRGDDSTEYYGEPFYKLLGEWLELATPARQSSLELVTETAQREVVMARIVSTYGNQLPGQEAPGPGGYRRLVLKAEKKTERQRQVQNKADVGIVTALSVEIGAVGRWLKTHKGYDQPVLSASNTHVHTATMELTHDELRVIALQAQRPGQHDTHIAFDRLYGYGQPPLVVMLGIAGRISDKLTTGDVVIGTEIVDYDPHAETKDGPVFRTLSYSLSKQMENSVNHYFAERGDPATLVGADGAPFTVRRSGIGSGSAVVKTWSAKVVEMLRLFNEKVLVVETEGTAAASYFTEYKEDRVKNMLIVRAVSDGADPDKSDEYQQLASQNAALALDDILRVVGRELAGPRR